MADKKINVRFPVLQDGEVVGHRELAVSEKLAKTQMAKKPRHRTWKGAEIVSKSSAKEADETKTEKTKK